MANVQLYRLEFIANNPYGEFVTGDILDIYLETSSITVPAFGEISGITVNLNGTPLGSSATLLDTSPSVVIIQSFNPQICSGTYLIVPAVQSIFPFAQYLSLADHYSCAVNPPTCDLIVVGVPEIVPASDETTADGQITVVGSSSLDIEYKIGSDFAFGDTTGQATGVFTGLLPGSYRIYLRDEANCGVSVLVTVSFTSVYGAKYTLEYDDLKGNQTKLEISKRGFTDATTEICGAGTPFELAMRGEGDQNKFFPLMAVTATVNLKVETENQFVDIYTSDPNLYRLYYYKDLGSGYELMWTGKILPFQYQDEYRAVPYYISFQAIDGLSELKDNYLIQQDGQKYYGTTSKIKLIADCLKTTKVELNILSGCNLYAIDMDQTAADDPFAQAYVDFELFYLAEKEPTLESVLTKVLEPWGCRLIQWENRWNIVRIEELVADFDYRIFDSDGVYVSNSTYSPVADLDYPNNGVDSLVAVHRDHNLEIKPGYGTIKMIYHLGLKPNILDNGDFRLKSTLNPPPFTGMTFSINKDGFTLVNAGYPLMETYEQIDKANVAYQISAFEDILENEDGGEAYVQSDIYELSMGTNNTLRINVRYKIPKASVTFGTTVFAVEVPYVKLRMRVKYGSQYLQGDGTWSDDVNILTFFCATFDEFVESEIIAKQPITGDPSNGNDFDVRVYHAYAYHALVHSVGDLEAIETVDVSDDPIIPTGYKLELRDDFTLPDSFIYYYELEENTDAASGYLIIRPDDYHAVDNPRQWILKKKVKVGTVSGANVFGLSIDRITVKFLVNGQDADDAIIRLSNGEPNNKLILEKEVFIGSSSSLIVTETDFSIDLGIFFPNPSPGLTLKTVNVLSNELIYAGWLRDVDGNGYEYFKRDGIEEEDKLHSILLQMYATQYNRSWRTLRGSFQVRNNYFGLLNVVREVNDEERIYLPMSLVLNDFRCEYSGERHELMNVFDPAETGTPFTSGFTFGFGSSAFN